MANKSAGPSISAPSAGGAIQGIGEKFSADLQTGTANFTVPINVPAGRNGFQPTLSFQYSSGSGNGPLGLGWALGVPSLSRKTSQKTPIYDDARDTFLLSGAEDLVLIQEAGGVATYRPRTETLFARIEHHRVSGNDHWQVRSGTGFVNDYGTDGNVLADPADPSRIFCWKLTRSVDPFGAQIVYTWDRDAASTQSYLSRIDYLENGGAGSPFLVSVEFDYEERPDPFSTYRSGFEIRTTRRCTGLSVFTHATGPTLQRSYRLTYADQLGPAPLNRISLLVRIELTGHDGALTAAMPPADFAYTPFDPAQRKFRKVGGAEMPAESIGQPDMDLVDLFGQGLPDIVQMGVIVRYWRNLGNGQFDVPRIMQNAPTVGLADPGVQFMDTNGDSRADLMVQNDRLAGYFPLRSGGHWDAKSFRSFRAAPTFSLKDPEVKLFDLDGDGITDALRTGSRFECFFHDPAQGWSESREYQRRALDLFPNVNFSDPRVRIANLTGDGMQNIVLIHAGGIDYWPNLSYGKFGARIHMRGAPRFPYNYNPKRILIGDVDGDGADDLVYVEDQQVTLWINQSGNQWSEPVVIRGTPPVSDLDALRLVDLLGCGAKGILWSSTADAAGYPRMSFLDLSGGTKPYLLHRVDNHIGALQEIEFASSTAFYLDDEKRFATKWKTSLPFPVQVVARVRVEDRISGGKLVTEYRYHHGYWDGADREFRGFARVDTRDTETFDATRSGSAPAFYSPPTETRTWFHPGPVGDEFGDWSELDLSAEYWVEDPQQLTRPSSMTVWLNNLPRRSRRDAFRSLRGRTVRSEFYAYDGDLRQNRPFSVSELLHGVVPLPIGAPWANPQPWQLAVFFPHLLADRNSQWERGIEPMSHFTFQDHYDTYGQAQSVLSTSVPRGRDYRVASAPGEPYLATFEKTSCAFRDDATHYLTGRLSRQTNFEVVNDGSLSVFDLHDKVLAGLLPMRVLGQTQHYYDRDPAQPLNGAYLGLPLGQLGDFGMAVRTLSLALTKDLLHQGYRSGAVVLTPAEEPPWLATSGSPPWTPDYPSEFRTLLAPLAGYLFQPAGPGPEDVEGFFATTESSRCDFHDDPGGNGRGMVLSTRNTMGGVTTFTYDPFQWMPIVTTDPNMLSVAAEWDYRTLQARQLTDVNGNITVHTFTPLGFVSSTADLAKPGDSTGDTLAMPGSRIVYDLFAFRDASKPISLTTTRRVHHVGELDVPAADRDRTIQTVEYCDGFGRILQSRVQMEDTSFGDPFFGDAGLPADFSGGIGVAVGVEQASGAPVRVLVSGTQAYDNKGRTVERFETYFDQGWDYLPPTSAQMGEKVTLFYDAAGRTVRTLNPDGSEQRVLYGVPADLTDPARYQPTPWESYSYDANDNAGRTHSVESAAYLSHWNTPMSIVIDGRGRTIESVLRKGPLPADELISRTTYDLNGRALEVTDPLGRVVSRHVFDLAGNPLRVESLDAGVRRAAFDARGDLVEHRESNGTLKLTGFDAGNRAIRLWGRDAVEPVTLRERTVYGDETDSGLTRVQAQQRNVCSRAVLSCDEAGTLEAVAYDFKGNLLEKVRRVVRSQVVTSAFSPAPLNWSVTPFRVDWTVPSGSNLAAYAATLVDAQIYQTLLSYDGIGRVKNLTYPRAVDGTRRVVLSQYNAAGALESLTVDGVPLIRHIAYNARGQRLLIAYGNGTMTRYCYQPQTFALLRVRTEAFNNPGPLTYAPSGPALQDFHYTCDLVGNLIGIQERTPGCGIPGTALGQDALDRTFTYDPLYRILSADGRECDRPPEPAPWDNSFQCFDSKLTRPYREQVVHDDGGNVTSIQHSSLRVFQLAPGTNRLAQMQVGADLFHFEYDSNGNLMRENTERFFAWDANNRMRVFRTQTGVAEPSVYAQYFYDAGGQRVQKVVRLQGGKVRRTVYIDGIFEHHQTSEGESNEHHILDNQNRIALWRKGAALAGDPMPELRYQVGDHLSSANLTLSSTGAVLNREEFTPFGLTSFGGYSQKRYRFTGMEREEESGLCYHGARYFAPWLARWISCDPSGMVDGPNLYQYVRGNPLTQTDRSGKQGDLPPGGAPTSTEDYDFQYPEGAKTLPAQPEPVTAAVDPAPAPPQLKTPPRTPPPRPDRNREEKVGWLGAVFPAMMHGSMMPQYAPGLDDYPEWQKFQAGAVQEAAAGAAHANLVRGVALSGIAAGTAGYALAAPSMAAGTAATYDMVGSAGLRLLVTYPRLTMAAIDLMHGINGTTLPRVGLGVGCAAVGSAGMGGAYRTASTAASSPAVSTGERQLAVRAGQLQDQLWKSGLGFWAALKSSVSVGSVDVAGQEVRVVTHTNPKAWEMLRSGIVQLEPGEILGPSPDLLKSMGLRLHSEQIFGTILMRLNAPGNLQGAVGSWPLGCYGCQAWLLNYLPNIFHQNPKP